MPDFRGVDDEPGWERREFRKLWQAITQNAAARRLEAAVIGRGGVTVKDRGNVHIQDGGGIDVAGGGGLTVTGGGKVQIIGDIAELIAWGAGKYAQARNGVLSAGTVDGTGNLTWPSASIIPKGLLAAVSQDTSATFAVGDDGAAEVGATAGKVRLPYQTTSAGSNARLLLNGELQQVTSSRRFKQDIEDAHVEPWAVYALRPRTWRQISEVMADPSTTRRYIGAIAEELLAIGGGLEQFVEFDELPEGAEGPAAPHAIAYDRLFVAVLVAVQDLNARVIALEEAQ